MPDIHETQRYPKQNSERQIKRLDYNNHEQINDLTVEINPLRMVAEGCVWNWQLHPPYSHWYGDREPSQLRRVTGRTAKGPAATLRCHGLEVDLMTKIGFINKQFRFG